MSDPLEDLVIGINESHQQFIEENNDSTRAFQSGTLREFISERSSKNDGGSELEGETSSEVLGSEDRGESGESETDSETI